MEQARETAAARRREIQQRAAAMGVDEDFVARMVAEFYRRVRAHPLLGPIFEDAIGENWGPHLARMTDFWSSVAMNTGRYSGKPAPAHRKLSAVRPWHFNLWLGLFRQTLEEIAPTPAAAAHFIERAERIAQSLQMAMFDSPTRFAETAPAERPSAGGV